MVKNRTATVVLVGILSLFASAAVSFGQDTFGPGKPHIAIDLSQPADSPLRLTRIPSTSSGMVSVQVENVGQVPVIGFVIVGRGAGERTQSSLSTALDRWLLPGSSRVQSLPVDPSDETASYAVDYVRFAGGGSWGADTAHMSFSIDGNLAGRQAAIDKIKELVSTRDHEALMALLGTNPAEIDVAVDASQPEKWQRGYRDGYRSVISFLAPFRDQGEEAFLAKLASLQ
jgi:hypothetical protein